MPLDFVPFDPRPGIAAKRAFAVTIAPARWPVAAEPFTDFGNRERLIRDRAWVYALAEGREGPRAEHWARAEREAVHASS